MTSLLADVVATPSPTTPPQIDPDRVSPGGLGFLAIVVLAIAAVVIFFSMRKQLGRVDFEEGKEPAGSRRVDLIPPRQIDVPQSPGGQGRSAGGTASSTDPEASDPA
ncbi:MAG: hypothetical protein ACOYD0_03060 [Candidatus Nanopelagicales bacterium]